MSHVHHQWPLCLAGYQNAGKEISSVNPNKQNETEWLMADGLEKFLKCVLENPRK